ncbi:MAG TPA: c-type cytochrome [Longimicrobiales bacterium]|nr:c-type cytochrome [Longimicrobiales bacterium]
MRAFAGALALAAAGIVAPLAAQDADHPGKAAYDKWCAGCHGVEGDGQGYGAEYMLPRPRDFTQALYQIRTTESGALPTDADILRVIDEGMPGTTMPGWRDKLTRAERAALADYLKTFSRFFETEGTPEPLDVGRALGGGEDGIAAGREVYERVECWKCHGDAGRGDGTSAPDMTDDDDHPIRPADLSEPWTFNGGGTVADIYMRLRTGLDGTPMPSSSDLIASGVASEEDLWNLAHYVRSLGPERFPEPAEVIRAGLVDGDLPDSPADSAWADQERFWVPLVGQIVVKPRWFAPSVDGVWVQAAHDGEALALRLVWHDPSESPSEAWDVWRQAVESMMQPQEGDPAGPGLPDAFSVQFPAVMPDGRELPFFLGGDARRPVYIWHWSATEGTREVFGRGLDDTRTLSGGAVTARAEFEDGKWRLVLRRPLDSGDDEQRLGFVTGEAIPVAFRAWDGSNAEAGPRGSISSWYYVHLAEPTPTSTYAYPVVAAVLAALLGLFLVRRAQKGYARGGAEARPAPAGAA